MKHITAQQRAEKIYGEARRIMLAELEREVTKLDALYERDAATLKERLRSLFQVSGIPERAAAKIIDEVFSGSRAERLELVRGMIKQGALAARGMDEQTFDAIFGGSEAGPLVDPESAS